MTPCARWLEIFALHGVGIMRLYAGGDAVQLVVSCFMVEPKIYEVIASGPRLLRTAAR